MRLIYCLLLMMVFCPIGASAAEKTGTIAPVYCNSLISDSPLDPNRVGGIDVLFLNGIDNRDEDARESAGYLLSRVVAPMRAQYPEGIRVGNIYNPTGGMPLDVAELRDQAQATNEALIRTQNRLTQLKSSHPHWTAKLFANIEKALYSSYLRDVYIENFLQTKKWHEVDQDGSVDDQWGDGSGSEFIGPVILKVVASIEERLLAGRRVVIVAHSQGNHFMEAAYVILKARLTTEQLEGLQVVGVAVVANTTPHNRWVTIKQDYTVYRINVALTDLGTFYYTPLGYPSGNFDAVANKYQGYTSFGTSEPSNLNVYTWAANGHSFNDIYLNDQIFRNNDHSQTLLGEVRMLVKDAIDQTLAATPVVSLGTVTATLSWINDTDMDLHVLELFNDGSRDTHVYYSNKRGRVGYLDLDDTDGQGPEHYYTNTYSNIDLDSNQCIALQGKTLEFYINPYTRLRVGEPTVLNIRVGSSIYSRSITINSSDRNINSGKGKLLFMLNFGANRQFTIKDDL